VLVAARSLLPSIHPSIHPSHHPTNMQTIAKEQQIGSTLQCIWLANGRNIVCGSMVGRSQGSLLLLDLVERTEQVPAHDDRRQLQLQPIEQVARPSAFRALSLQANQYHVATGQINGCVSVWYEAPRLQRADPSRLDGPLSFQGCGASRCASVLDRRLHCCHQLHPCE